jgi:hypothetical protein
MFKMLQPLDQKGWFGLICSTHGRKKFFYEIWWENLERRLTWRHRIIQREVFNWKRARFCIYLMHTVINIRISPARILLNNRINNKYANSNQGCGLSSLYKQRSCS